VPTIATKTPRKQIPLSQQNLIWMYSAGQCSFFGCPIRTERPETHDRHDDAASERIEAPEVEAQIYIRRVTADDRYHSGDRISRSNMVKVKDLSRGNNKGHMGA
jgi:hypothetical protein